MPAGLNQAHFGDMTVLRRSICVALGSFSLTAPHAAAEGWQTITVPGSWESQGPPEATNYDGVAWYRTWVLPHDEFFASHERNLFEESVSITLPDVADAHEVFVNAVRIGGAGKFPPAYSSGRDSTRRHKVPPGTLKKGQWNEIAIRIFNRSGPGGFFGEAPFIMDYFQECVMAGTWEFRLGDNSAWSGPALAQKPSTSAFYQYRESNRLLGESPNPVTGPKLPPAESAAKMMPHAEFVSELMLHEPLVAQPVHLSFDERGRLWVAQYRQYPYPAGVHPISRDKYYRTHYDAVPAAPPNHVRGRDQISVHEDTDGDGRFDRHVVFQDGLNMANAALAGHGGVWVMHTPHLLFYPDKNGDAVPDGQPEVRLAGFGLEDSHSVANGLVWGVDGWIYGGQGSTCSCRVTRPGIDPPGAAGASFEGCMVWRYHPDTKAFEIFAEGSGNTFGVEQDSEGRLFSGHNGGETRGWHYVQGGFYLKQGVDPGKFGPARYPWTFGDLPMMPSRTPAVRFTHFFAVGEGTALPSGFYGRLFALDPLHNIVICADRQVTGSSFATADVGPAVKSSDSAFRPVYITHGPDGSLFVADLYEHYIAHGQHYQSQIDASTGRIYRLRGKDSALEKDLNLSGKSGAELVALLRHPNKWHRQTAVRLLGEQREPTTRQLLLDMLGKESGLPAVGALWSLFQAGWLEDATLEGALRHGSPVVRKWAVQFIGERSGTHPGLDLAGLNVRPLPLAESLRAALIALSSSEPAAEVRSQLACTARRLPASAALPILRELVMQDQDAVDPFLPHLCWYALEHHLAGHEQQILLEMRGEAMWQRPMLRNFLLPRIMRRLVTEGRQPWLLAAAELLESAPSAALAQPLIEGFNEAVQGKELTGFPDRLLAALAARGGMTLPMRLRKGEPSALTEAVNLLLNRQATARELVPCLRIFGEMRIAAAVGPLLEAAADEKRGGEIRRAALAALGAFEQAEIPDRLLALIPSAPPEVKTAIFSSLTHRNVWTGKLLAALQSGALAASSVPLEFIEVLRQNPDKSLSELAVKLFPPLDAVSANWNEKIAKVEAALRKPGGNPYEGEKIFAQRCSGCHRLFFKGGSIGPDLTAYQRDNLGTMLVSIINPNAEIREGFASQIIQTADGQTLSAYILEQTESIVRLRGMDGQTTTLPTTSVKSISPLGRSLMPEGLLEGLADAQLRDLFAWLRQSQPISK